MRFAYADPPYLGCCKLYDYFHGDEGCWDDLETHEALIQYLCEEFDGWAMSATSGSLRQLLPLCPDDVRVGAWTKSFASFKKGVNPAYAWEPVIFRGARTWAERGGRDSSTVRDWMSCPIVLRAGFTGSKPTDFALWMLGLLGVEPDDEFVDVFPGSGAVGAVWESFRSARPFVWPSELSDPFVECPACGQMHDGERGWGAYCSRECGAYPIDKDALYWEAS